VGVGAWVVMGSSGIIGGMGLDWETSESLGLFFAGLGVGELKWWLLRLRDGRVAGEMGGIMGVGAGDEKVKASLVLSIELGWAMWSLKFSSNSSKRALSSS